MCKWNHMVWITLCLDSSVNTVSVKVIWAMAFSLVCSFMLLCMHAQSCPTLCNPMDCSPPGSSVHGDFPGKNTIVSCHSFLQGIVPTQGSNPCLLCLQHWQVDSLPLHNLESSYSLLLLLLRSHFGSVRLCATP